jgi:hypothetical protein
MNNPSSPPPRCPACRTNLDHVREVTATAARPPARVVSALYRCAGCGFSQAVVRDCAPLPAAG